MNRKSFRLPKKLQEANKFKQKLSRPWNGLNKIVSVFVVVLIKVVNSTPQD